MKLGTPRVEKMNYVYVYFDIPCFTAFLNNVKNSITCIFYFKVHRGQRKTFKLPYGDRPADDSEKVKKYLHLKFRRFEKTID